MTVTKAWRPTYVKETGAGQVSARFSVFGNIDSDGDVIMPGALDGMNGRSVPMPAYGHASWNGALPIGIGTIRTTHTDAVFDGRSFNTQAAQDTREVLMGLGELGEWSFGLDVEDSEPGKVHGRQVRLVKQVHVYEVSPVFLGANPETATLAVKSTATVFSPAEVETLKAARLIVDDHEREQAQLRNQVRRIAEAFNAECRVAVWCQALGAAHGGTLTPVGEQAVPAALRGIARSALTHYAKRLGTPVPALRWFTEPGPLSVHGATNAVTDTVLLNAHENPLDVWITAGHEIGHLAGWNETQCRAFEQVIDKEFQP